MKILQSRLFSVRILLREFNYATIDECLSFFILKRQLIRLFTVFCFSGKVTARSEKFSMALKLFHADSIALHEELEKAEANRSLGKSETEPKILSHGREKPVLYLFRTLFGLAQVTPESDSESSSLALLHWLSD